MQTILLDYDYNHEPDVHTLLTATIATTMVSE